MGLRGQYAHGAADHPESGSQAAARRPRSLHLRPRVGVSALCVPRDQFQSCSNCEVQHSYIVPLLQTISSVFGPAGGQP